MFYETVVFGTMEVFLLGQIRVACQRHFILIMFYKTNLPLGKISRFPNTQGITPEINPFSILKRIELHY